MEPENHMVNVEEANVFQSGPMPSGFMWISMPPGCTTWRLVSHVPCESLRPETEPGDATFKVPESYMEAASTASFLQVELGLPQPPQNRLRNQFQGTYAQRLFTILYCIILS